jgi:transcriptional regulator with XRE-family HTH domain
MLEFPLYRSRKVVSFPKRDDSKPILDLCQAKSKVPLNSSDIFARILKALEAKNAPDAARKLGISKQAVYDWQKNTPSLENLVKIAESTGTSLDWLLRGADQGQIALPKLTLNFDELLERRMREIAREEIAIFKVPHHGTQDLGTVDEFNLESAVKKYDNALPVLREWYAHDKLPFPEDLRGLSFEHWETMTLAQKVKEVRAVRNAHDEERFFDELTKTSQPAGTSKKKI